MELVEKGREPEILYYIPHHPIIKDSSSSMKVSVVFDAFTRTFTGIPLNQILMVGPAIQDLVDILL